MKTSKKILSVLLALTLVLALSVCAFAAEGNTVKITSKTSGHSYQAYQVFSGKLDSTGKVLSDIQWGTGVDGTALLTALKADTTIGTRFTNCSTAADVAAALADSSAEVADAFAAVVSKNLTSTIAGTSALAAGSTYEYDITGLADGYYFINEDTTAEVASYTKFMLQVVGNVSVAAKTDSPTVTKKVLENNDAKYKNTWNDAADYSIGDTVPFRLVGYVPDMSNYKTYTYQFNDTLSTGLTLNSDSIKVYYATGDSMLAVNSNTATGAGGTLIGATAYTVTTSTTGFSLNFNDLKTVSGVANGGYIVVEYDTTLNANAVVGNPGNPNEVTLTYSNNPNNSGSGTPSTGTTPKDEVVVFTFTLPLNKTDSKNKALSGATFALFASKTYADAAASDSTKLDNALKFDGTDGNYTYNAKSGTVKVLTDKNGSYSINGLDQGTYYLVEIAAPDGYNKLTTAQEVKIVPTYTALNYVDGHAPDATNDQLTAVNITLNGGTAATSATVVNNSGSTLPSTGGIGTTIFTVAGIVLMIGAAVVLVTKRKVSGEDRK